MPQSNVAELNDIVCRTVANEDESPRIAAGNIESRVAGLRFIDTAKRQEAIQDRQRLVRQFTADKSSVERVLEAKGVTPLAVLPKKVWDRLCVETNLYRFAPNCDGKVGVDRKALESYEIIAVFADVAFWCSIPAAYAYAVLNWVAWGDASVVSVGMVMLGVALLIAAIVMANIKGNPYIRLHGWFTKQAARLLDLLPHRMLISKLLPEFDMTGSQYRHAPVMATLVFPTPPIDAATVLTRVRDIPNLWIAVVPEGFRIAERPSSLFHHEIASRTAERELKWSNTTILDPIVYMEYGSAVAVIYQYGEFPAERALIERICGTPDYVF